MIERTMKKAAIVSERQAALIDALIPDVHDGDILVKVQVAPMCAEYKGFVSGQQSDCLGHEAAGVVEQSRSPLFKEGDRVVLMPLSSCGRCPLCTSGDYIHCLENPMRDATMAQYAVKPAHLARHIPDDLCFEKASLACCALGPSFGALQSMQANAFDTILITGLGPVGLGAVVNAKFYGTRVIAVDSNKYRSRLATELGADLIVDPTDPDAVDNIREFTGGIGPNGVVECSGAQAAHRLAIDVVRRKGWVAFVGESHTETPIVVSRDLIRKGIRLTGSWHYNLNEFGNVLQVIERSAKVDKLISHVFPMRDIQQAFETSASQQCGKILLKPWE